MGDTKLRDDARTVARSRYTLVPLAFTDARFARFGPYVAAMGDDGAIAFQVGFVGGGSGVVIARDGTLTTAFDTRGSALEEVTSHPVFVPSGVAFYARDRGGGSGVYAVREGRLDRLDGTGDDDTLAVGPLGPTSTADGLVAYRATARDGSPIVRVHGTRTGAGARCDGARAAFFGLAIATREDAVLVRVVRADGVHAIELHGVGSRTVLEATGEIGELGLFPSVAGDAIVSAVRYTSGASALVAEHRGTVETLVDGAAFAHLRGGLALDGHAFVFATPPGGSLGVYCGPDPARDEVVAIGDRVLGAIVTDLAANPVSIGGAGALALRLCLDDGREGIFKAIPSG